MRKHPKAKSHSSNRARDLDPRKLVKMAGSLMQSVGGVNNSLKTIMEEESKDSL